MRMIVEKFIAQHAGGDQQMIEAAALQRYVRVGAQRAQMIGVQIGEIDGHDGTGASEAAIVPQKRDDFAPDRRGVRG
jgi:hypothetical protein